MSKLKVLLVYPSLQMVTLLPNNLAILSAYLKSRGIDVRLFDTTFYKIAEKSIDEIRVEYMQVRPFNLKEKGIEYKTTDVYEDFLNIVDGYRPDIIGVSATDDTYELGISLVSKIKDKRAHIIFGGIYPTFSPEEVINNPHVDSICLGEGEEALFELCIRINEKKEIRDIKNLWVKVNGRVYKNELRPPIEIKDLPYEDFSVFDEKMFFRPMQGKMRRMIPVVVSRGCPFICSFCAAPFLRNLYLNFEGKEYFRIKKTAQIIDELIYYTEIYKAEYIYFNSETFFAKSEEEITEFAKEYSRKINLPFWCQTRIETITEKRIKMLEDMNCDRINIGLEHGNEAFRKKVLKKYFTNAAALSAFKMIEKSRIPFTVNNMVGFPDETRELAFDTIRLNRSIKADTTNVFVFVPYRGTPLRQYCIKKGYLNPAAKPETDLGNSILNMPGFQPEQIKGLVRTFPLYVKMPESYFVKIRVAEQLNEEGDRVFAELRDIYFNDYLK